MNWQSLAIIGIIVILFIILMIINASATDLDDTSEDDTCCCNSATNDTPQPTKTKAAPKVSIPAKKKSKTTKR